MRQPGAPRPDIDLVIPVAAGVMLFVNRGGANAWAFPEARHTGAGTLHVDGSRRAADSLVALPQDALPRSGVRRNSHFADYQIERVVPYLVTSNQLEALSV